MKVILTVSFVASVFSNELYTRDSLPGEGTFYYPGGGLGSCGTSLQNTDKVCAVSFARSDSLPCGTCLEVKGPKGSIIVKVMDKCEGCKYGDVDLTHGAFLSIALEAAGRVPITSRVIDCTGRPPTPPPPPAQVPPASVKASSVPAGNPASVIRNVSGLVQGLSSDSKPPANANSGKELDNQPAFPKKNTESTSSTTVEAPVSSTTSAASLAVQTSSLSSNSASALKADTLISLLCGNASNYGLNGTNSTSVQGNDTDNSGITSMNGAVTFAKSNIGFFAIAMLYQLV